MTSLLKGKSRTAKLSKGDIKTKFESEVCPVHRERPVVTIMQENEISIYGCCTEFEDYCRKGIQRILALQAAGK